MNKQTQKALKMAIEFCEELEYQDDLMPKETEMRKKLHNACKKALEQSSPNINYDLYRNVDRPVNPEGYKK